MITFLSILAFLVFLGFAAFLSWALLTTNQELRRVARALENIVIKIGYSSKFKAEDKVELVDQAYKPNPNIPRKSETLQESSSKDRLMESKETISSADPSLLAVREDKLAELDFDLALSQNTELSSLEEETEGQASKDSVHSFKTKKTKP